MYTPMGEPEWIRLHFLWKLNSKCLLLTKQTHLFILAGGCWLFSQPQPPMAHYTLVCVIVSFLVEQIESFSRRTGCPRCPLSWPEQSMPHSLRPIKYWIVIAVGNKDIIYWLPHFVLEGRRFCHVSSKMNRI